ncbi:VolA/Pla-1 family phospholipase [Aeromonas jandaei]|uniref:VolA/Pla-1 family phospholipase n=1 Tax=Aeromonas jandaei TaxID=650 RepID=UPI001ADDA965|nr:VolA/Pla-1 family phospholipase [Aeromonas jandaei]QTL96378.1 Extracellular lipase precursor [Aeromonas jandaei]
MKKKLIYAAVISALLAGCGGENDKMGDTTSTLDYALSGMSGARPSVLAPRASDGTLKFSTETQDLSNPVSALSTLDGWSTTQPIQLNPATVSGVSVPAPADADFAASVAPIYLLELTLDPTTLQPNGVKNNQPLVYGTDFVVRAAGSTLNLVPLKPLNPSSYYMIVATDSLKDSRGTPLKAGSDYSTYKTNSGTTAQEQSISNLVALQEGLFKSATGITSDRVIFSDWFATQSGADVLLAVKGAAAKVAQNGLDAAKVWKQDAKGNTSLPGTYTMAVTGSGAFLTQMANEQFLPSDQKNLLATTIANNPQLSFVANQTSVFTGTVKLPYFLSTPYVAGSWDKAKTQSWHGAIPSLYAIANALKAGDSEVIGGLVGAGVDPTLLATLIADPTRQSELLTEASKLIGVTLTSGGKPLDSEHNIGRFNPLPALTEVQSVPMRIFAKDALNTITDVIIYQHGVTSIKENAYALALSQIGAGMGAGKKVAVVVIDHPLHGERGFALSGSMATVTTSANPTPYLNLGYLTVARDNLKQSVADLLGLRLAVGLANSGNVIGSAGNIKVHFLGHSLGAITGANLLAVANQTTGNTQADALFKFDTGGLAMPGGGIAPLLLDSPSFGPTIKMSVLTADSPELKAGFAAYEPNCKTVKATCFVNEFLPSLNATTQAAAATTLQSYSFAAQTVLDSADPINLGRGIKSNFPLFATEIVGDGALNLPDQVIPNRIASAPLGGTEPLFKVLGLQALQGGPGVIPASHHAARFVAGGHSSLLAPDGNDSNALVTSEMQTEFASFFMSGGAAVQVNDNTLLKQ